MKSNIKIMLLGFAFVIFGIYIRCVYIGYLYSSITEAVWTASPIIGFLIILYGFFAEDRQDDRLDELYALLLKLRDNSAKTVTCKKCGEEYKDLYNSCPKCGYNGHSESK